MHKSKPFFRKKNIQWIIAGIVVFCLGWFCYLIFGPNPPIIVSEDTTYIVEPLGADGLPDYETYLLQKSSEGVTFENNAAVLIWQAIWPGKLEQQDWLPFCKVLGMEEVPSTTESLVEPFDDSVCERIAMTLAKYYSKTATAENKKQDYFSMEWLERRGLWLARETIKEAREHSWTSSQLPELAEWVKQNQKPIDLLVKASKQSKYFSPSPSLLNDFDESLFDQLWPGYWGTHEAINALLLRSKLQIGEGRLDKAWRDLIACHRLARLISQNGCLVSQHTAIAIENAALKTDAALLDDKNIGPQLSSRILSDLQAMGQVTDVARSLDSIERLTYVDYVMRLASGQFPDDRNQNTIFGRGLRKMQKVRLDWNFILRDGNRWFDLQVANVNPPFFSRKDLEFEKIERKLNALDGVPEKINTLFNLRRRSELVSAVLLNVLSPAGESAVRSQDRANTQLQLTRLAAALAVCRADQGEYPEQLNDLVPSVIPKLPLDMYSGKPFIYQRKDDGGYLLYSVFENEIDDNGTDRSGKIIDGEWVDEEPDNFDYAASDLVIRVPVPAFKFPEPPSADDVGYGEYGGE